MIRRTGLLPLFLLLLSGPATAADLYVNNATGNDLADGRSAIATSKTSGPVKTIQRALRLAHQGDHIDIANTGHPYRETASLVGRRNSGLSNDPLILSGNGATLDGTQPIASTAWEHVRGELFRFRPSILS